MKPEFHVPNDAQARLEMLFTDGPENHTDQHQPEIASTLKGLPQEAKVENERELLKVA